MFAVALFYSINFFTVKTTFREIDPFPVLALRCIFSGVIFWIIVGGFIRERVNLREDGLRLLGCALTGVSVNQLFFLWGLSNTTEINGAVLMITTPVFVFVLSGILGYQAWTIHKITGLVIAAVGAFLYTTYGRSMHIGNETLRGDIMIIVNAASYGLYLVWVKPLAQKYHPMTITAWMFLMAAPFNVGIGFPGLVTTEWGLVSVPGWTGLILLIVLATVGAYALNAWAMRIVPPSYVGMYIFLQPVLTGALGMAIRGETLPFIRMFYIGLIFTGVYLVTIFNPDKLRQRG